MDQTSQEPISKKLGELADHIELASALMRSGQIAPNTFRHDIRQSLELAYWLGRDEATRWALDKFKTAGLIKDEPGEINATVK
jgi:hypothetical protein